MQPIPPLIVPSTHVSTGYDLPVITDAHRKMAEDVGVTVEQLLELEPIPLITEEEVKWKYACGQPLASLKRSRISQPECINCINGT